MEIFNEKILSNKEKNEKTHEWEDSSRTEITGFVI